MFFLKFKWEKVFKNGPSKICERQALKNLKGYGLLKNFKGFRKFYLFHSWIFCPKLYFSFFQKFTFRILSQIENILTSIDYLVKILQAEYNVTNPFQAKFPFQHSVNT